MTAIGTSCPLRRFRVVVFFLITQQALRLDRRNAS